MAFAIAHAVAAGSFPLLPCPWTGESVPTRRARVLRS
jgi:hypothetical protein